MTLCDPDGTVHFSSLKQFARSPAHYKAAIERPMESTRGMRIGTGTHHLVLGPTQRQPVVWYPGASRRGKEWDKFAAENEASTILTAPERAEAEAIATAVLADREARKLLESSRYEVPLSWLAGGIECGTRGIDVVGDGYIADLKVTRSTKPDELQREVARMHYHAQMAFYDAAARANHIDVSRGMFLLCVESKYPFVVTVLEMTERVLEEGRKCVGLWLEKLRQCDEADHWPGYVQAPVPWQLPSWLEDEDDAIELDDEEDAA